MPNDWKVMSQEFYFCSHFLYCLLVCVWCVLCICLNMCVPLYQFYFLGTSDGFYVLTFIFFYGCFYPVTLCMWTVSIVILYILKVKPSFFLLLLWSNQNYYLWYQSNCVYNLKAKERDLFGKFLIYLTDEHWLE